jgi:hypothetical protein
MVPKEQRKIGSIYLAGAGYYPTINNVIDKTKHVFNIVEFTGRAAGDVVCQVLGSTFDYYDEDGTMHKSFGYIWSQLFPLHYLFNEKVALDDKHLNNIIKILGNQLMIKNIFG